MRLKKQTKMTKRKLISVIIPTFNQEKTIEKDLRRIKSVLDQLRHDYEMIVVVDGCIDKTLQNAKKVRFSKIVVSGYEKNHGKGYAIRYGMAKAKGDIVAFIDAGMDLNPNGISMLLEHFEWYQADVIIGSKWHPVSKIRYPLKRKIISFGYAFLVRTLFSLKIRDTQLGMKFFKREVLQKVLPRLLVKKYAFDIEMLAVADHFGYKRIFEAPIELYWRDSNSNVSSDLLKSIWDTFIDTIAVFYRLNILHYYDKPYKVKNPFAEMVDIISSPISYKKNRLNRGRIIKKRKRVIAQV